jgi:hypothetical protein
MFQQGFKPAIAKVLAPDRSTTSACIDIGGGTCAPFGNRISHKHQGFEPMLHCAITHSGDSLSTDMRQVVAKRFAA